MIDPCDRCYRIYAPANGFSRLNWRTAMFKRILVPIDGSHTSSLGFAQALALAREQGATLCVLHIVDELIVTQGLDSAMVTAPSYVDELLDDLRANGRKLLATAVAKAQKAGVATVSILVETIG